MEKNKLQIEQLRAVIQRIFDLVQKDFGIKEVILDNNYYWSISEKDLYLLDKNPAQLDVGSLLDDLEFVRSAYEDADQALPLLLLHIAPLLTALATKLPNFGEKKRDATLK